MRFNLITVLYEEIVSVTLRDNECLLGRPNREVYC